MKRTAFILLLSFLLFVQACQESAEVIEFTGRSYTYNLISASTYNVSGAVTFKEKTNGNTVVMVELDGTEGNLEHPVHLHLGDMSTPDADIAALLSPIIGNKGKSETLVEKLADETKVSYADLLKMEAYISIHLAEFGAERDIILAAGNIGAAYEKQIQSGRRDNIAICKSN